VAWIVEELELGVEEHKKKTEIEIETETEIAAKEGNTIGNIYFLKRETRLVEDSSRAFL
jgi:hypothetical protein